jgi:hypothetical protein
MIRQVRLEDPKNASRDPYQGSVSSCSGKYPYGPERPVVDNCYVSIRSYFRKIRRIIFSKPSRRCHRQHDPIWVNIWTSSRGR